MSKNFKYITIIILLGLMLLVAGGFIGGFIGYDKGVARCEDLKPDTIVIHHTDTMEIALPPDTLTLTYYKTVQVPSDAVEHDTVADSFNVTLPYEQHLARIDSVADIYYSGYDSKIDSVIAYRHYTTQVIKQPYEVKVIKQPTIVIDAGIGNYQWQKLDPYAFVRATYNPDKWKIGAYAGITYSKQWMFGVEISRSILEIP